MCEIAPPRNLTPGRCKTIEAEMLKACAEVAAKHGPVAEGLGMQAMDPSWSFEFGVRVSIPLPDGSTLNPERMLFEALAEKVGQSPDDFGREFSTGRERRRSLQLPPSSRRLSMVSLRKCWLTIQGWRAGQMLTSRGIWPSQ